MLQSPDVRTVCYLGQLAESKTKVAIGANYGMVEETVFDRFREGD